MTADQQDPRAIADRLAARAGEWYGTDLADDLNAAIVALRSRPTSPAPEHATPDREVLVQAFMAAEVKSYRTSAAKLYYIEPDRDEAERMADVALAASPVPAVPDRTDFPTWPWDPEPFVEAVDALQAKVIEYCGDSESYIGTQGEEAIEDACRELVVFAEKARDLMPEPFVTPDLAHRVTSTTGEDPS